MKREKYIQPPIVKEIWRMIKANQKQHEATEKKWAKWVEEQKAMDKANKKALNEFIGDNSKKWGKLTENLVTGNILTRLKRRGFKVTHAAQRVWDKGFNKEYDIVITNGKEVIVVEAKTSLKPHHIYKFIKDLGQFKELFPEHKKKKIYGGIAFLTDATPKALEEAQKAQFFIISATGDVRFKNPRSFKPKAY